MIFNLIIQIANNIMLFYHITPNINILCCSPTLLEFGILIAALETGRLHQ